MNGQTMEGKNEHTHRAHQGCYIGANQWLECPHIKKIALQRWSPGSNQTKNISDNKWVLYDCIWDWMSFPK